MKYNVWGCAGVFPFFTVEADNEEEAIEKARDEFYKIIVNDNGWDVDDDYIENAEVVND